MAQDKEARLSANKRSLITIPKDDKHFQMFILAQSEMFIKAKRNLIVFSILGIAATWFGLMPEKLLYFGLDQITKEQQVGLLWAWLAAGPYFVFAYFQAWFTERQYHYL